MSDEAAFLRAIQANPTDGVAYLVYADWLDEHGEPERAAFLRSFARSPKDVEAAVKLGKLVGSLWIESLTEPLPPWDATTLRALGRLEGLLSAYQEINERASNRIHFFEASLVPSAAFLDEWQTRLARGSLIARHLSDWETELKTCFVRWLLGPDALERKRPLNAIPATYGLECVRNVLRPTRGWRVTGESAAPRSAWDDVALEAADRVLFLHFSSSD
jgi:uncharacterized protein (TIGR02996 family)